LLSPSSICGLVAMLYELWGMGCVGAAENDMATCVYHEDNFFGGVVVSSFMFGGRG
jgi:hypothetical protein